MRLFFSAGEPSGDLHSAALINALRARCSALEVCGFGGPHMRRAGCDPMLFPLAEHPVIGVVPVLVQLGRFLRLASEADRFFRHQRPDAVVLVDNPGFNWWVARRAHFHRIPVFYFLPPQVWAWATWRVSKMRRFVDHVLCSLPFEAAWYEKHGVRATYTGHPYFEELQAIRFDSKFLAEYASTPQAPVIGILPGSRTVEVKRILPMYLRAAERIARVVPGARFPIACLRADHLKLVEQQIAGSSLNVRGYVGRTPEIIHSSYACLSKSGSVSLELLHHAKPSTILYQVARYDFAFYRFARRVGLFHAPYITLVNLMASRELLPEFVSCTDVSGPISRQILTWLEDPAAHARIVGELQELKNRVATPGSTHRTAQYIIQTLGASKPFRTAA